MKMTSLRINGRAVSRLSINGREVSIKQEPVVSCDALCFTAQEAGSTVKLTKVGSPDDVNLQTSTDGGSWTPYTVGDTITLVNKGDKVYWKAVGTNNSVGYNYINYNGFVMTGKIAASGNVNSLLEEDENTARTMSLSGKGWGCYCSLFKNCSSLTQAPELPATTLTNSCYDNMFSGCKSLTKAPALPATTLAQFSYTSMFVGCTSLTQAPELPATTLAALCYSTMFQNCQSLTKAPALPATTLANSCYDGMFSGCKSLTQAPELPATTLADSCYKSMFYKCLNLNHVKVGFTNWTPTNATNGWLPNNSGTFECPQALIDNTTTRSTSTVPESWTMVAV